MSPIDWLMASAFAQRAAADGFHGVQGEVAAIEDRDWQQVEYAQAERHQGEEAQEPRRAHFAPRHWRSVQS